VRETAEHQRIFGRSFAAVLGFASQNLVITIPRTLNRVSIELASSRQTFSNLKT